MRIRGSVAVVTGASSGIGRATARALAARGARVVLVARDSDSLDQAAAECAAAGAETLTAAADVSDPDAVDAVATRAVERFGRIDAWVNAASVMMFGSFVEVPLEDLRRVLDVNLMGYVHGCRAALPRMIDQGHGVVVNVSSLLGVVALPYGSSYTMAKFAIRGLSGSLRQELRLSGVRGVTGVHRAARADRHAHLRQRRQLLGPPLAGSAARLHAGAGRAGHREPDSRPAGRSDRRRAARTCVLPAASRSSPVRPSGSSPWRPTDGVCPGTEAARPGTGNLYRPAPGPGRAHGGWHGRRRERRRRAIGTTVVAATLAVLARRRPGCPQLPGAVTRGDAGSGA